VSIGVYVRIRERAGRFGWYQDGHYHPGPGWTEGDPWKAHNPSNGRPVPFYPRGHITEGNAKPCDHLHTVCLECVTSWDDDYEVNLEKGRGPDVRDIVLAARAARQNTALVPFDNGAR
jgi:hypothetical protein